MELQGILFLTPEKEDPMNKTYNSMILKLVTSLKTKVSSGEQILKDHTQQIYEARLSPEEIQEYISLAEFEEEDDGYYFMSFTLPNLEPFTLEEREAFCRKYDTITVGIWIAWIACEGVNIDNGICSEESWEYTWHGN